MSKRYNLWSCTNVCDAFNDILDNIFIRLWWKLYKINCKNIHIKTGTTWAPLVADFVLFCYERVFILSDTNQAIAINKYVMKP